MPVLSLYLYLHFPNLLTETQPLKTKQQGADGPTTDGGEAGGLVMAVVLFISKRKPEEMESAKKAVGNCDHYLQ